MDTERMKTSLVALGGMAGALTAIWGAAKLIVIVPEAIKKRLNARRERKEATMRELIRQSAENDNISTLFVSDDDGSLKPICPSEPIPSSCKSIPPQSLILFSYWTQ